MIGNRPSLLNQPAVDFDTHYLATREQTVIGVAFMPLAGDKPAPKLVTKFLCSLRPAWPARSVTRAVLGAFRSVNTAKPDLDPSHTQRIAIDNAGPSRYFNRIGLRQKPDHAEYSHHEKCKNNNIQSSIAPHEPQDCIYDQLSQAPFALTLPLFYQKINREFRKFCRKYSPVCVHVTLRRRCHQYGVIGSACVFG